MVNNYLVCIDDIERKGDSLPIKRMGLVDELAQRKKCKVVLIFNQNSLSKESDREEFERYREKVVDIELNHDPTHQENLECVFDQNLPYFKDLLYLIKEFNIKNIRILKKINWIISEFWEVIKDNEDRIKVEFLTHVVLFCWSYYRSHDALDFDFIMSRLHGDTWLSYLSDKDKKDTDEEKKYKELATNLALSGAEYDPFLIHMLVHGYVDLDEFAAIIEKISKDIAIDVAGEELRKAWDIYSGSFADNLEEFKAEIKSILDKNIDKIKLYDFASAVDVLSEFGEVVDEYIDKYAEHNQKIFSEIDISESLSLEE